MGHGGEFWQNVVHWRREWQTSSAFLPWEPHEQYEQYELWASMTLNNPRILHLFLGDILNYLSHLSSIPGLGRSPGGGHGNPLQYSSLENPHGQRSLAGYSPWGHKLLDTTEWLNRTELFMGFSRQECCSGLPFPSLVDHILSELSTMTHPS